MKFVLLVGFLVSAIAQASPIATRFFEENVIRRVSVVNVHHDGKTSENVELEYMITSDGSLWERQILPGNVAQLPFMVSLAGFYVIDFAKFEDHLFAIVDRGEGDRHLVELNVSNKTQRPYAWVPKTLALTLASGIPAFLGTRTIFQGHVLMGVAELGVSALIAYFAMRAVSSVHEEFYNTILVDEWSHPLSVLEIRRHSDDSIAEIYVKSKYKTRTEPLSGKFGKIQSCRRDLRTIDSPPIAP